MEILQGGVERFKEVWLELERVFPLVRIVTVVGFVTVTAVAVAPAGTGV